MAYKIIKNTNDGLEIEIKRKANLNLILFTGFLALGCMGVMLRAVYETMANFYKLDEERMILFFLLVAVSLFLLKLFLWQWRGKEKIMIHEDEFKIIKTGTILSVPRKYELHLIENFKSVEKPHYPAWVQLFGIAGGQVEFYHLGEAKYFGQTLTTEEAHEIINLIYSSLASSHVQAQV